MTTNNTFHSRNFTASPPAQLSKQSSFDWSSSNMYRTSYTDMHKSSPSKNKSYAIPGYSGHIPGLSSDGDYGKRFSIASREHLSREKYFPGRLTEKFPKRPSSLSPASSIKGRFGGGLEEEYHTVSRLYGKSTIPVTHPNYSSDSWSTNYGLSYKNQENQRHLLYRKSDKNIWKKTPALDSPHVKASGFVQNSTLFDGHGWLPLKEMHGDQSFTEYRKRFNSESGQGFRQSLRKMNRKKLVY